MSGGGGGSAEVKETKYEKELAAISKAKWDDYQVRFVPFENTWIKDVTRDTASREHQVAGQVNADIAQKLPMSTLPAGIDPSQGNALTYGSAATVAKAFGRAEDMATQEARNKKVEGLQAVVDVGRGQSTNATLTTTGLAKTSVKEAITDAYSDWNEQAATTSGIGQAIGAGYGLYNSSKSSKSSKSKEEE